MTQPVQDYATFLVHRPLDGVLHQFAAVLERQLILNVRLIGLHRLHAEVQLFGDLRVLWPSPISRNTSSSRSERSASGRLLRGCENR